jgi:hypothetical protein
MANSTSPKALQETQHLLQRNLVHSRPFNGNFPSANKNDLRQRRGIGCYGYSHQGGAQMTESQEKKVIVKCVELASSITGSKPRGWRAPLYQIREHTVNVLEERGFLYGNSNLIPVSP